MNTILPDELKDPAPPPDPRGVRQIGGGVRMTRISIRGRDIPLPRLPFHRYIQKLREWARQPSIEILKMELPVIPIVGALAGALSGAALGTILVGQSQDPTPASASVLLLTLIGCIGSLVLEGTIGVLRTLIVLLISLLLIILTPYALQPSLGFATAELIILVLAVLAWAIVGGTELD